MRNNGSGSLRGWGLAWTVRWPDAAKRRVLASTIARKSSRLLNNGLLNNGVNNGVRFISRARPYLADGPVGCRRSAGFWLPRWHGSRCGPRRVVAAARAGL